jgi:hypothetical protein
MVMEGPLAPWVTGMAEHLLDLGVRADDHCRAYAAGRKVQSVPAGASGLRSPPQTDAPSPICR